MMRHSEAASTHIPSRAIQFAMLLSRKARLGRQRRERTLEQRLIGSQLFHVLCQITIGWLNTQLPDAVTTIQS
ncbi:hypothetical protein A1O1_06857 [Capronia coronata CBS 617.96]|uniref:Uncharacterized protein n=1 Tax=Capronia coronata CBS 617.96 TaxID=1182541 RepID=W9XSM7_9EURO|nr:uncharacterized protein A1O1_06857 [Capronia coronata CBS 617.96]EXJ83238.1 hypothetical protein A1O1_06857 [Capronia coronata CBS 617.96]